MNNRKIEYPFVRFVFFSSIARATVYGILAYNRIDFRFVHFPNNNNVIRVSLTDIFLCVFIRCATARAFLVLTYIECQFHSGLSISQLISGEQLKFDFIELSALFEGMQPYLCVCVIVIVPNNRERITQ